MRPRLGRKDGTPSAGRRTGGFTLIELVMALLLLALLVVSAGPLSVQAVRGGIKSENQATAMALAEDALECVKQQVTAAVAIDGRCNPNVVHAGFVIDPPVVDPDPPGFPDVGHVSVTVSWGPGAGNSVTLQTLLADAG